MKWAAVAVLGGLSCIGCVGATGGAGIGGGQVGKPVALFPSQADLNRVASQPVDTPKSSVDMADVDSWQMQQPADTPQYPSDTTWDQLVLKSNEAQGKHATLSTALRCAAEEAARFYTVNGGMPDDGLREHMLLRCGSTAAAHGFVYITGRISDSMPMARVEASGRAGVERMVQERLAQGGQFGLASARGHGRYAVVAFSAVERATLEPFSSLLTGNSVTLSGELLQPAGFIVGLVTHGAYGVEHCESDPFAHPPAFHVTCPIAAEDTSARIEIVSRQEGRVLLEPALDLEVRRDEHAELEYNARAYGENKTVASSAEFRDQLLADLNRVRGAAGLTPYALEALQSQTDERFAPALAQSLEHGDPAQQNTIALGLLAGWDVHSGLIRNGGFFLSKVNTVRNPSRWLTQALESPLGRLVLLEPDTSRIAIGTTELSPTGEMAVVTTYAFFDSSVDHRRDEDAVLAELDRVRRAHGVAAVHRWPNGPELQRVLQDVSSNAMAGTTALDELIAEFGRGAAGYVVETTDIKQLRFDPLLVESSTLDVEIGVTHYRAPGAAWGQYVVLILITQHGSRTRMAEHHVRARGAL